MSEALILASTNTQYDKRLFIELRVQFMKIPSSEHVENMLFTQIVFCFDIQNNLCTQHVLSLKFSCTELVIQWTIFCHIISWGKNKCLWKRFTCTITWYLLIILWILQPCPHRTSSNLFQLNKSRKYGSLIFFYRFWHSLKQIFMTHTINTFFSSLKPTYFILQTADFFPAVPLNNSSTE